LLTLGQLTLDGGQHRDIGCALRFAYAERGRVTAVEARKGTNLSNTIVHVGYVAEPGEPVAGTGQCDLGVTQRKRRTGAAQHPDRLFAATDLGPSAGRIQVERAQLLVHVHSSDAEGLHARRIELDADFAVDTAAAPHLGDTGDASRRLVTVLSTNQEICSWVSLVVATA